MRPNEMHRIAHAGCHDCCSPHGWRQIPILCGDYDLDATIMHRANKDLPLRLPMYLKKNDNAYGYRTAYNGYEGYSGDD